MSQSHFSNFTVPMPFVNGPTGVGKTLTVREYLNIFKDHSARYVVPLINKNAAWCWVGRSLPGSQARLSRSLKRRCPWYFSVAINGTIQWNLFPSRWSRRISGAMFTPWRLPHCPRLCVLMKTRVLPRYHVSDDQPGQPDGRRCREQNTPPVQVQIAGFGCQRRHLGELPDEGHY